MCWYMSRQKGVEESNNHHVIIVACSMINEKNNTQCEYTQARLWEESRHITLQWFGCIIKVHVLDEIQTMLELYFCQLLLQMFQFNWTQNVHVSWNVKLNETTS